MIFQRLVLITALSLGVLGPAPASAMPILSADGTTLSGVMVEGAEYEVTFGNGSISDLGATYPSPNGGEAQFTGDDAFNLGLKDAIEEALEFNPASWSNLINGCDREDQCVIYSFSKQRFGVKPGDDEYFVVALEIASSEIVEVPGLFLNTIAFDTIRGWTPPDSPKAITNETTAQFRCTSQCGGTPNPVPAPATLALFGVGLVGLGWRRSKA